MTDLLSLGRAGVMAYRTALSAVADNVSNAETPGYARRSVTLQESKVSFGTTPIYIARSTFGGVDATGVQRAWDDFKAASTRLTAGDFGRADARSRWLVTTEGALGDGENGVAARITAFFNAGDALASDPGGELPRRQLLLALDDAAATMRATAQGLARTAAGVTEEAQTTVDQINADLTSLAKINGGLQRTGPGSSAYAQIADERDRLLDKLAGRIGIDVTLDQVGRATVTLSGASGATLVSGNVPALLGLGRSADGRLSLAMNGAGGAIALHPVAGSIAGLIDVASNIADRRAQLDGIAQDFATALNDWQAQGSDAGGLAGAPLLSITGGADTLTVATSDPAAIAAAAPGGAANGNLLALSALRGTNGAEGRWAALVSGHAQIVSAAKSETTAATARNDGAFAERDEISGIDLDREAAELIRFQQAYDGSARIIQIARETLQSILDII